MEDLKEFAALVVKLRTAQKNFFKTRDTAFLIESKGLERVVDKKADEILNGKESDSFRR